MRRKRRNTNTFSLAFLDCICCGFGAIILLFVLSMGGDTRIEQGREIALAELLTAKQAQLEALQAQRDNLAEELGGRRAAITETETELDKLLAQIANLQGQIAEVDGGRQALVTDLMQMEEEVDARQKVEERAKRSEDPPPVGVPIDSTHLIFIVDTSGSMRAPGGGIWPTVLRKIEEALEVYPEVQGMQILDANGNFVLGGTEGRWIPDSPDMRLQFLRALQRYEIYSNSNPVPGIIRAMRVYGPQAGPEMRIGLYIFGDEFTGRAEEVLNRIDRLNPVLNPDTGERMVTINAVGFPHVLRGPLGFSNTGLKFANLMRELSTRHGGAFITVDDNP